MNIVIELLFWTLLTVVVFAGCYWITSELGVLLVHVAPSKAASVRSLVLGSSLAMTTLAMAGITRLLMRR